MRTLVVLLFVIGLATRAVPGVMPYFVALAIASLVIGFRITRRHLQARALVQELEQRIVSLQQILAVKDSSLLDPVRYDTVSYVYQALQRLRTAESCLHSKQYAVAAKNATTGLDGYRQGQKAMRYFDENNLLEGTVVVPTVQERLPIIANKIFSVVFGICFLVPSAWLILPAMALVLAYISFRMFMTYDRRRGQQALHRLQRAINKLMEEILVANQLDTQAGSHLFGAIDLATSAREGYISRNFFHLRNKVDQASGEVEEARQRLSLQMATAR
jgi:hypothetical protein